MTIVLIWQVFLAIVVVTGILWAGAWLFKARTMAREDELAGVDDLTDFREMHDSGALDEEEFKQLKKILSQQTLEKITNPEDTRGKTDRDDRSEGLK